MPATVLDSVLARLIYLPAPSRDILELASVIPGPAELWLLDALLHPDSDALDASLTGGFLVTSGQLLTFRHELVRMAIEESLSMGRRKELHRSILQILNGQPAGDIDLARLVHHAAGAADARLVIQYAPEAARRASQHGAHREAARYYEAALGYSDLIAPEERARLLDDLSFENYLTGQIDPAIQARQNAVDLWRQLDQPQQVGDDLRWLSRLYWFQGNKEMADRFAEEAISTLEILGARQRAGDGLQQSVAAPYARRGS